jgi:hypothetical protein
MDDFVGIQPKDFVEVKKAEKFKITIMDLILFKSVSLLVALYDKDDKFLKTESFLLEGEDYHNWGNSDDYIVSYVLTKLSLYKL